MRAFRSVLAGPGIGRALGVAAALLLAGSEVTRAGVMAGADFSLLPFFEQRGVLYKSGGTPADGLALLKAHGLTCVRLRLFTSSAAQGQADPYNYANNLAYTVPLAVRVKSSGLEFLLDFHYSDTWADPGHQAKPAAWVGLSFAQLAQQVRNYTSNSIAAFRGAGAMPDYVQLGNEITGGMLWPDGAVGGINDTPAQWANLGTLLKAAAQGLRDAAGAQMPRVIIHIDRGGDWNATRWFFDNLNQQSVPFDWMGESYYPFWHGSIASLANCLSNAAARYGKPVLLAETAFPWTNTYWSTNMYGFPPDANGQALYTAALAYTMLGLPAGRGAGIVWWGAEYQAVPGVNEAGFNTASFFDSSGNVLPVADAVGGLGAPLWLSTRATNSTLNLEWPPSGAATVLATSTNLVPPYVWRPVNQTVESNGLVFRVTVPMEPQSPRWFHLQPP